MNKEEIVSFCFSSVHVGVISLELISLKCENRSQKSMVYLNSSLYNQYKARLGTRIKLSKALPRLNALVLTGLITLYKFFLINISQHNLQNC